MSREHVSRNMECESVLDYMPDSESIWEVRIGAVYDGKLGIWKLCLQRVYGSYREYLM